MPVRPSAKRRTSFGLARRCSADAGAPARGTHPNPRNAHTAHSHALRLRNVRPNIAFCKAMVRPPPNRTRLRPPAHLPILTHRPITPAPPRQLSVPYRPITPAPPHTDTSSHHHPAPNRTHAPPHTDTSSRHRPPPNHICHRTTVYLPSFVAAQSHPHRHSATPLPNLTHRLIAHTPPPTRSSSQHRPPPSHMRRHTFPSPPTHTRRLAPPAIARRFSLSPLPPIRASASASLRPPVCAPYFLITAAMAAQAVSTSALTFLFTSGISVVYQIGTLSKGSAVLVPPPCSAPTVRSSTRSTADYRPTTSSPASSFLRPYAAV